MKIILNAFIDALSEKNKSSLNSIIDENCLFISHDSTAILSKLKVIDYLSELIKEDFQIKLLNIVQDSNDTLLSAYQFNNTLFGSAIIRFQDSKIIYIKNILVQ